MIGPTSTGAAGAQGPAGPAGATGPAGPTGPTGAAPTRAPTLDANHLHAWLMNDAAGNFQDTGSSASPVALTASGGPIRGATGILGNATLWGDNGAGASSNTYASALVSAFADMPTSNVTYEGWFQQRKRGAGNLFGISYAGSFILQLEIDGTGITQTSNISAFTNSATTIVTTDYSLTQGWHHFMLAYDGAHVVSYMDGEALISHAQTGAMPFGAHADATLWFCGDPKNTIVPFVGIAQYFLVSNVARSQAYARAAFKKGMAF